MQKIHTKNTKIQLQSMHINDKRDDRFLQKNSEF
jgi:hypothetical protein